MNTHDSSVERKAGVGQQLNTETQDRSKEEMGFFLQGIAEKAKEKTKSLCCCYQSNFGASKYWDLVDFQGGAGEHAHNLRINE